MSDSDNFDDLDVDFSVLEQGPEEVQPQQVEEQLFGGEGNFVPEDAYDDDRLSDREFGDAFGGGEDDSDAEVDYDENDFEDDQGEERPELGTEMGAIGEGGRAKRMETPASRFADQVINLMGDVTDNKANEIRGILDNKHRVERLNAPLVAKIFKKEELPKHPTADHLRYHMFLFPERYN